ncbi:MAG: alkaline phosphatase family protein [Chloroflexi bacterium]|nr:alkaline phosphatase family protein [Chloroflexota bacterium]MBI3733894.1 alkaline phosphatase family protein [Chloroflexota bacterium]
MPDPLAKSFYRRFRDARAGWLRRLTPFLMASLGILALGGAAGVVLVRLTDSVINYRSPIARYPQPGDTTDALSQQVVMVVVDGLREDVSRQMPTLQHLRAQGAAATAVLRYAFQYPSWTTLVSGADAEINDTPLVAAAADAALNRPVSPETLFGTARRARLNVAIAARRGWQPLVSAQFLNEIYLAGDDDEEEDSAVQDRRTAEAAVSFLTNFAPNFLLVHLRLPDDAAYRYGAASPAYRQAVWHTDQLIAQIAAAMDLRQSVLLVTSSYGNIDQGGHGGTEDEVTRAPLVLVGSHIKAGEYGSVRRNDIAPTVAALIGSAIPSASQGSILFPMLEMSDAQKAIKALALAQQQRLLGLAYTAVIGGNLTEPSLNDPLVAKSSFEVKNYDSAFTLAYLAAQQVQNDMRAARAARIDRERLARAPIAVLLVVAPLIAFWFRRSLRLMVAAWIAVGVVALQHLLYLYAGHTYSFSDISSLEAFVRTALERNALALLFGGLLAIIYHWRDEESSRSRVALTVLLVCALSVYVSGILMAFAYYLNGFSLRWYIGDLSWGFVQVFNSTSIIVRAVLALPVAIFVSLTHWLGLIVFHRLRRLRIWGRLKTVLKAIGSFRLQVSD